MAQTRSLAEEHVYKLQSAGTQTTHTHTQALTTDLLTKFRVSKLNRPKQNASGMAPRAVAQ
jgi:hypothetical protein